MRIEEDLLQAGHRKEVVKQTIAAEIEQRELYSYVKKELKEGFPINKIWKVLIKAGHPRQYVRKTIRDVQKELHKPIQPKPVKAVERKIVKKVAAAPSSKTKAQKRVVFFIFIFLISLVPIALGYQKYRIITMVLGGILALISIIGLFNNLGRARTKSPKKIEPAAKTSTTLKVKTQKHVLAKAQKAEKKIVTGKKISALKFMGILAVLIALINVIIFVLPKFKLWIYMAAAGGIVFGVLFVLSMKYVMKKKKMLQPTTKVQQTVVDSDIQMVLRVTDDLLGNLPEEKIKQFAQSKDFELYERVLTKYRIK